MSGSGEEGAPSLDPGARSARSGRGRAMVRAVGGVGLALGVPSLLAPGVVSRLIGVAPTQGTLAVLRGVGVQEVGVGIGLLTRPQPSALQWSRVAGDVLHLALLGRALTDEDGDGDRTAAAAALVFGVTVVDVLAAVRMGREAAGQPTTGPLVARRSITVRRPVDEVYRHWRQLENLPEFMWHLRSVEVDQRSGRSHWVARAPAGRTIEWDAEIVEDRPGERIAWRSVEGSTLPSSGTVTFAAAPQDMGTEVHVELSYDPPGGSLGAAVATLLGESPDQQVADDLRRFKQVLETGEVLRSDGTPEGTLTRRQLTQRPAQPAPEGGRGR